MSDPFRSRDDLVELRLRFGRVGRDAFAREAGLDVQGSKGMEHNPISGRYWLSNDTSVNYMLATRRPQE